MSIKEDKLTMNKDLLLDDLSMLCGGILKIPKLQQEKDVKIGLIIRTTVQRDTIKRELSRNKYDDHIEVFSIDNLQGIEKDIIILAIIESSDIIYLSCLNRLNNAMTRARSAFYIAGRSSIIQTPIEDCSQWNKLIEHAKRTDQIKPISSAGDYGEIYNAITKLDDKENQDWW